MKKSLLSMLFLAAFTICIAGCGEVPHQYYDAGFAFLENGQYEEALSNFSTSLNLEKETKECYRGQGIAYLGTGAYDEACESFLKALSLSHGGIQDIDYDINYYLGYSYRLGGHYEEALEVYNAIITLKPKESQAYYQRALCRLKLGDRTGADEDIRVLQTRNPGDYDLFLEMFFSIKEIGEDTFADEFLHSVLDGSDKKMSDYDKGRILFYIEDYSNARVYLEKSKDMANPETYLMLGKTYEAIGDYQYAASLYNSYLDIKGNNAAVYNQLGICRCKRGDYEGAISAFSFGINLDDPEWNKVLLFNEAVAYEKMLDFETAKVKFEEYYKLFPSDETAKRELVFLETR